MPSLAARRSQPPAAAEARRSQRSRGRAVAPRRPLSPCVHGGGHGRYLPPWYTAEILVRVVTFVSKMPTVTGMGPRSPRSS